LREADALGDFSGGERSVLLEQCEDAALEAVEGSGQIFLLSATLRTILV